MKKPKLIETHKNEITFTTSDLSEMKGKYLAKNLQRGWEEEFVDQDTGQVVSIKRHETIAERGTLIDNNILSVINFHLTAGDVSEVEVSTQKRLAYHVNCSVSPWSVSALIGTNSKKHRFLLYANSIQQALDIAKDYIELNYEGSFQVLQAKDFNSCVIIKEELTPIADGKHETEKDGVDKKFYQIEVRIYVGDYDYTNTFVLQAKDADSAMIVINKWIDNNFKERALKDKQDVPEFVATVESAVIIPCSKTIEMEFTQMYLQEENNA